MSFLSDSEVRSPLSGLRQLVQRRPARAERCELCAGAISPDHQHLLEIAKNNVVCACDACALLFSSPAAPRYRRIPRRLRRLTNFVLDDQQWDSLLLPISLAYFFHSSTAGRVLAYYPSPGGAIESLLDLQYWNAIAAHNPILKKMEPDVEALLVNRVSKAPEYFLVPIDRCYRLVGLMRMYWRGLSGGAEVWRHIDQFFAELKQAYPGGECA
jgi:uncharacterized protein DUF5947